MPPPRLQRPASRIRTLSAVAPARGLDVEIYDEISEKSCPVSVLAHLLPTGPISSPDFFWYVFSDLRPIGGVGYPSVVAIVDACVGGFLLGSERKLERPEEHMSHRLRRKLPFIKSSKFLLRGERSEIRELRTYSTACLLYTSPSPRDGLLSRMPSSA